MNRQFLGFILIIIGVVYLVKPNIFRIGIWRKTSIPQQAMNPKQYNIFMRILGVLAIVVGIFYLVIFYRA
jgi:uncharacterized membrane protein HdeD (DUF308 family)